VIMFIEKMQTKVHRFKVSIESVSILKVLPLVTEKYGLVDRMSCTQRFRSRSS